MVTPPPLLEPGNEENRKRFVLPALREGYARARRAARDNGTADGGWLCVPRALSLISLDGVIPADEEIFLPDRVHLNFKGTKKLAPTTSPSARRRAMRSPASAGGGPPARERSSTTTLRCCSGKFSND